MTRNLLHFKPQTGRREQRSRRRKPAKVVRLSERQKAKPLDPLASRMKMQRDIMTCILDQSFSNDALRMLMGYLNNLTGRPTG